MDELIHNQDGLKVYKTRIRLDGRDGIKLFCNIEPGAYREIKTIIENTLDQAEAEKENLNILLHSIKDHFKNKNQMRKREVGEGELKKIIIQEYVLRGKRWQWTTV